MLFSPVVPEWDPLKSMEFSISGRGKKKVRLENVFMFETFLYPLLFCEEFWLLKNYLMEKKYIRYIFYKYIKLFFYKILI